MNHPEDQRLPEERNRLKTRIIKAIYDDERISAAFFGGSVGNGTEDLYSDIDLRIIAQPDQLQTLTEHKIEMAGKWSDILFIENAHLSRLLVVHYTNFIKMDLFF
ncbi:hypothetical protein [Sporolactobacillus nakayamae]|uniref:Nucleotidyltransferase domain-containing protein n=1 Tax=Sporolactobacillus nakayamae TaxID=269670 RepID=A0A1I2V896_9BACL|nr:hypothetical protein [Sporolactobacillus nakayamae]SFG85574.1 hypothetical protein SAMN02982927_03002 [Sporolactobacillus nakayamae]